MRVLIAFLLIAAFAAPASAAEDSALGRAVDAWAKPLVDSGHLSGQLLVSRHGAVVLERSFGLADRELQVPVTPETRFNIASITKPMTTVLAFQLLNEKRFGVDDSIAKWFPDFPRGNEIRVIHLLRHRSGIRHELVPDSLATQPRTAAEMVEIAKRLPLDFTPGARESYSSGGYTVLARILEIVSGRSYGVLLEERLLKPLGMTHTSDHDSRSVLPGRATAYVPGVRGFENAPFQDLSGIVGAGSVWSNARDLDRFVQAIVTGRLGPSVSFALVRGGKLDFNGRTAGFRAFADWDSTTGLEVIFAGNSHTGAADLLRSAIPRLAAGERVPPPSLPALASRPVTEADAAPYLGRWKFDWGLELSFTRHDGALWANEWVLQPTADGRWFSPRDYGLVRVVADAGGATAHIEWKVGDATFRLAPSK